MFTQLKREQEKERKKRKRLALGMVFYHVEEIKAANVLRRDLILIETEHLLEFFD